MAQNPKAQAEANPPNRKGAPCQDGALPENLSNPIIDTLCAGGEQGCLSLGDHDAVGPPFAIRIDNKLAAYFRPERAIAAARRFISAKLAIGAVVSGDGVASSLRRRRELLPDAELQNVATEAMRAWPASRADRFGRRA